MEKKYHINPPLRRESICFLVLIFIFIFCIVFPAGGLTTHIKAFKALCAMVGMGLILCMFLLYFRQLKILIIPTPTIFFILYLASLHLPFLYKDNAYDKKYYLGLYCIGVLLFILVPTGLHYIFSESINEKGKFFLVFLEYFTYVLLIISLLGLPEYFIIDFLNPFNELSQGIKSTFGNSNYFGNFLIISLPLVLSFATITKKPLKRSLALITVFLMLMCAGFTLSRYTVMLCFAIIPLFLFGYFQFFIRGSRRVYGFIKKHYSTFLLGGALFGISLSSIPFFHKELMRRLTFGLHPSRIFVSRYPVLLTAWKLWIRTPIECLFGYGSGAFYSMVFSHYPPNFRQLNTDQRSFKHMHNEFLEILFEGGNLAGILFGIFILIILFYLYKAIKNKSISKEARIFSFGLCGAIAGHLIFGIFSLAPRMPSSLFLFYLIIAFSFIYSPSFKITLSPTKKMLCISLILLLFSYSFIVLTYNFLSEYYHFKSLQYDIYQITRQEDHLRGEIGRSFNQVKLEGALQKIKKYKNDYEMSLKKAIVYNPHNIYALYALLYYHSLGLGTKEDFLDTFKQMSAIIPHYRDIDYMRSQFHINHGEWSLALQWVETYLRHDAFFEPAVIDRIILLLREQKYKNVVSALAELIEYDLNCYQTDKKGADTYEYIFGEDDVARYVKIIEISDTGTRKYYGCYYSDFFKEVNFDSIGYDELRIHLYRSLGLFYRELNLPLLAYNKYLCKVPEPEAKRLIIDYYQGRFRALRGKIKEKGENNENLRALSGLLQNYKDILGLYDEVSFSQLRHVSPHMDIILSSKRAFFLELSSILSKLKDYRSAKYYKKLAY